MTAPKLRFKEFDGCWVKSTLSQVAKVYDGTHQTPNYVDQGIKFVSVENIDAPYASDKFITKEAFEKDFKNKPQVGDILMTRITAGVIGATALVHDKEPLAYYVSLALIRPKENLYTPFLNQYISTPFFKRELHKRIIHVAFPKKINLGDINECKVVFSPLKTEQTKIASFLSSVDEKISQITQKHALLNQYKQGMMQKLFSQQIRFKADDGCEFGEWKHCKLKDVLISYRLGGNYSNAEMVTSYPLIKMGNLGRGSINLDKIEYIPEDQIIDPKDLIKKNDLFFNTRNTLDLVGKVALWRGELPIAYYNSNLLRLDFENNIFMNYLFNEQKTLEKLKAIASGTTSVAAIYTKDLLKINLEIPCLEEQNKIASFLSSIDQKIEVVAQQIEQAKTWKKGLLQQMFV